MAGTLKASVASRTKANCGINSSGGGGRCALYASYSRFRNVTRPASKITAICVPTCSFSSFASMLVKPNTAFTGVPSGRVIGGRAWKARKMKPDPSIRIRCRGLVPASDATAPDGSMSAGVIRSGIQNVEARAVRAHHFLARDAQVHPRMTQRAFAAVAGDGAGIDVDDLGGFHRIGGHGGGAVRHECPFGGLSSRMMIAMRRMLSTMLRCLTCVLLAALLLTGCTG